MGFLRQLDRFGSSIPAFNIKGKDKVKTTIGGIISTTIIALTLGYFVTNFNTIIQKDNPITNQNTL